MAPEKNKEYILEIIDNGFEGEGIAKIDNFTVFIPGALKGEIIKTLIVKVLSSHAFGKIIEIIKKSKNRITPDCTTYQRCGGCNLRHVEYEETLNIKQKTVQTLVNKMLKQHIKVMPTIAMGNPYNYRNKLQFPVGIGKDGKPIIGVFANRTHEIIPIENCMIQDKKAIQIAKYALELINKYNISIYNEKTSIGLIRHIIVKTAKITNEHMVIFVINGDKLPNAKEISKKLQNFCPTIRSIILNINKKNTNVILGTKNITILGNDYIIDKLGEYYFKISPLSFYQVNPVQAEAMYNYAIEEAKISKNDIVFDLYCGIGTISIFIANFVKKVYGVEIINQAVEMANENAKLNGINNICFMAGDAKVIFEDLIKNKKIIPNVIVVDPPRKGLDENTIKNILNIKPKKIVYISCNPATLARDLAMLENEYEIKKIQPFDLFAFTSHVEVVTLLELKNYMVVC